MMTVVRALLRLKEYHTWQRTKIIGNRKSFPMAHSGYVTMLFHVILDRLQYRKVVDHDVTDSINGEKLVIGTRMIVLVKISSLRMIGQNRPTT